MKGWAIIIIRFLILKHQLYLNSQLSNSQHRLIILKVGINYFAQLAAQL